MPKGMKAELKGLSLEMAETVGAYLMKAAALMDDDPEAAFQHAEAARRRAARLPITREASAEAAYAAGRYEDALTQYRAWRRMTGSDEVVPVMVDCLRALQRYRDALSLAEEGSRSVKDPAMRVELVIVVAGVRADMGQSQEALRLLRHELERPTVRHPRVAQSRLLYAYADRLMAVGDRDNAYRGFAMAASLDPDGNTAALDRLDEFDGMTLELDEDEFAEEEQEPAIDGQVTHPASQDGMAAADGESSQSDMEITVDDAVAGDEPVIDTPGQNDLDR
ncbi:MAG: tetratricopeptide repeat protein [Propionibacteriaceae bacterium]|nr:tetratricopeptide repeat protein [Propionibacteriaceae bacterium]